MTCNLESFNLNGGENLPIVDITSEYGIPTGANIISRNLDQIITELSTYNNNHLNNYLNCYINNLKSTINQNIQSGNYDDLLNSIQSRVSNTLINNIQTGTYRPLFDSLRQNLSNILSVKKFMFIISAVIILLVYIAIKN